MRSFRALIAATLFAGLTLNVFAAPTGLPGLSSRPGSTYTLYLDFGGFDFTQPWGETGQTPGWTPAYGDAVGAFSAGQVADIKEMWARAANAYAPFNINVTTVDPAVAAGQAGSDDARLAYYDSIRYISHTIVGGDAAWFGTAGGVSYVGVAPYLGSEIGPGYGWHTNFSFADVLNAYHPLTHAKAAASAAIHEDGHALGLLHQSDHNVPGHPENEYSRDGWTGIGDTYAGDGSRAPIMGVTYYSQRGTWRVGYSNDLGPDFQNDVSVLGNDPAMGGQVNDGVGHDFGSASALALAGKLVDAANAKGIIVSADASTPNPIGVNNYSKDFYSFHSDGGVVSLTVHDGTNFFDPQIADAGATLDSDLEIYDHSFNLIATGLRASDTLSESFNGALSAGNYFLVVRSHGGYQSTFDVNAQYYDMGAYFITGNVGAVPEPATFAVLGLGILALRRRRK